MQVPEQYVIEIFKQAMDGKIDVLEKNIKEDIQNLREEIRNFQTQCRHDMKIHDTEIEDLKNFKYKMYAYSGAIAFMSAVGFKLLFH